jgi:hypothetical protein
MMMKTQVLEKPVVRRLEQLAEFYRQEQASELMERTLDKLLHYEADTCRQQLRQYVEWASLFQMVQRLEKRIALLEREEHE